MEKLIEIKNLKKIYKMGEEEVRALDGVDLVINRGDFLAIVGSSGSGKSTLMNMLSCLDVPTSGDYIFKETDVFTLTQDELATFRNKEVGCIFQKFNLLPRMNCVENVIVPSLYKRMKTIDRKEKAIEILKSVGLEERMYHKPNELSGGQQQRVAIARSLICDPDIILADEPTGNLDTKSGHQVMEIIKRLNQEGRTIVMITHDPKLANEANRVVTMQDGKIISDSGYKSY